MNDNQFRNGQTIRETSWRGGRPHGIERVWHRNGVLAEETPFEDGLTHGLCRRWAEDGTLLGEFHVHHGTGLLLRWYANGQLASEIQTVGGAMSGRARHWLRDGTLVALAYYLNNVPVTRAQYHAADRADAAVIGSAAPEGEAFDLRGSEDFERTDHSQFVDELLTIARTSDALPWLDSYSARQIGDSNDMSALKNRVGDILKAGATNVVASRLYSDKTGQEFSDHLVIGLPEAAPSRSAVREATRALAVLTGGAILPKVDLCERHLVLVSA